MIHVTTEALGPGRTLRTFRADAPHDASIPQLGSYWEIETDARAANMTVHYVRKDGWHVVDVTEHRYVDETRVRQSKAFEAVPDYVRAHLPTIGVTPRPLPVGTY